MTLNAHLNTLENAGLIALAVAEPDLEYFFRHGLIQDAAYDSLLKSDRHSLHRMTGEVLEALYPDRREELAPILAEHFWQAGENQHALEYFLQTAEAAARIYANSEAIHALSTALRISAGSPALAASILQARGSLYEMVGEFDLARADQEASLEQARSAADSQAEWQALINLGMLWAARDYRSTGEYYRQALQLARHLGDERLLGHSLNRLGNYYINIEEPEPSWQNHQEALAIFSKLEDREGIAETVDLLGMASALGGDLLASRKYYLQGKDLFEQLGDEKGLVSVLSTLTVGITEFQTDTMVTSRMTAEESIRYAETANRIAREIGWPSGEIYSLISLGMCLTSIGNYDRAQDYLRQGLKIAVDIHHLQWEILSRMGLGAFYYDLILFEEAQEQLERGLELALENNSPHWVHTLAGMLASTLVGAGDLDAAQSILTKHLPPETPAKTLGQRLAWCGLAELALAQNDPQQALKIVEMLVAQAANLKPDSVLMRPWMIWAETLFRLAEQAEAGPEQVPLLLEADRLLNMALIEAKAMQYHTKTWRIHKARSRIFTALKQDGPASQENQSAREILLELGGNLADLNLRKKFMKRAMRGS